MGCLVYRDYAILPSGACDESTGKWIPVVSLIWMHPDGNSKIQFITDSFERFLTSAEAEASAEALGKAWVDRHCAEPNCRTPLQGTNGAVNDKK
jgi:hypothetical protein